MCNRKKKRETQRRGEEKRELRATNTQQSSGERGKKTCGHIKKIHNRAERQRSEIK
jgi:hypothetical protein